MLSSKLTDFVKLKSSQATENVNFFSTELNLDLMHRYFIIEDRAETVN